jgi:AcrR family transcriptional regulator
MQVRERASSGRGVIGGPAAVHQQLGHEHVIEIQRARLLVAMTEVSAERGGGNATVAHVVERAGVSRRTFYEIFEDREACFVAAFDEGIARAKQYVLDAYDTDASWLGRMRVSLAASLSFLDMEHPTARLLVVGSLEAGAVALDRRRHAIAQLIDVVDEGRGEVRRGVQPPSLTAEGVVGAALSVIHARLLDGDRRRLAELAGPLMSIVVLPYLGAAAARRELQRPTPKQEGIAPRGVKDPLRDLGMRLTYRTVRVLISVAAKPGSSNREIGLAAGISDQGQISKLLGRLDDLGLVSKSGVASGKGAPNAWTLTARGREVERTMAADLTHKSAVGAYAGADIQAATSRRGHQSGSPKRKSATSGGQTMGGGQTMSGSRR